MHNGKKIGYLPKPHSAAIARQLDGGEVPHAKIATIDNATLDVRIAISAGVEPEAINKMGLIQ